MAKSKLLSGQSKAAKARANTNSHSSKQANDRARQTNSDIDWDKQIANLRAYFARRDHKKVPR